MRRIRGIPDDCANGRSVKVKVSIAMLAVISLAVALVLARSSRAAEPTCTSYNPDKAKINANGGMYYVEALGIELARFPNEEDGVKALRVVKQFNQHCTFDPNRLGRGAMEFWLGSSEPQPVPEVDADCMLYAREKLKVESDNRGGWAVTAEMAVLVSVKTKSDADQAMQIISRYSKMCAIGRGVPVRSANRYVMMYWR